MRVQILATVATVAAVAADILARASRETPELVLGLPTGRTVVPLYDRLAALHETGRLDLSRAWSFNLDELLLPAGHPASFRAYMQRHAWERIGLRPEHCAIPDPEVDPDTECRRYDRVMAAAGGLDLAVLGVGVDGHVAYNLPGMLIEESHVVELPDSLSATLAVPAQWRPLRAITVGLGTLRAARRLLLLATGESKRRAAAALLAGEPLPDWPCTELAAHPSFDVLLDGAAAPVS